MKSFNNILTLVFSVAFFGLLVATIITESQKEYVQLTDVKTGYSFEDVNTDHLKKGYKVVLSSTTLDLVSEFTVDSVYTK